MRHAFAPHVHDGFGLDAIGSNVERFRCRGADHLAPADSVAMWLWLTWARGNMHDFEPAVRPRR